MGSVTALGCVDPSMAGMVVDSPFTNLRDLICDIARKQNVPRVVTKLALRFINNIIKVRQACQRAWATTRSDGFMDAETKSDVFLFLLGWDCDTRRSARDST